MPSAGRGHAVDRGPHLFVVRVGPARPATATDRPVRRTASRRRRWPRSASASSSAPSVSIWMATKWSRLASRASSTWDLCVKFASAPCVFSPRHAARRELGPGDELFGFGGRADLRGHHAVDARLQGLGHRGIVGDRHAARKLPRPQARPTSAAIVICSVEMPACSASSQKPSYPPARPNIWIETGCTSRPLQNTRISPVRCQQTLEKPGHEQSMSRQRSRAPQLVNYFKA